MIGIYKITSPSRKIYIGQSINIQQRIYKYKSLRCKSQRILYASILKYGWDKHIFEILCECNIEELNDKERYYQDLYQAMGIKGMNCMLTTSSTKSGKASDETIAILTGRKLSDETKAKMRAKIVTDEHKKNISNGLKGRIVSEDTKAKISASNKGKKRSEEYVSKLKKRVIKDKDLERLKNMNIGRKHSDEIKNKLSLLKKGIKPSEICLYKSKEKSSKIVLDTQNGIYYNSCSELAEILNIKRTTLSSKLSGRNKNNTNYIYC